MRRVLTLDDNTLALDRLLETGGSAFYISEKIGPKRSRTPDGFLLCQEVPVARTGEMLYHRDEPSMKMAKMKGDARGFIFVDRSEADVFNPEFMASFQGKPVVNGHPGAADSYEVNPGNWARLAKGVTLNPRRGAGDDADLLIVDLLVQDQEMIKDIEDGKVEVSAGYAASYEQIEPGRARQFDMLANHVAIVPAGRCGMRCAIGDAAPNTEQGEDQMRAKTQDNAVAQTLDAGHPLMRWWAGFTTSVRAALAKKDEAAVSAALDAAPTADLLGAAAPKTGDEIHVHAGGRDEDAHERIGELEKRVTEHDARHRTHDSDMAALKEHTGFGKEAVADAAEEAVKEALKEEAPAGTQDKAAIATDSEFLAESHQAAVAGAEILMPGMTVPSFERGSKPAKTLDDICKLRRRTLDLAYSTRDGRALIEKVHGKKMALDSLPCRDVRDLFNKTVAAQSAIVAARNTTTDTRRQEQQQRGGGKKPAPVVTLKGLNEMHREHYKKLGDKA